MDQSFLDKVICGDAISTMQRLPVEAIDMIMFSPPYYGLRNYGGTAEKIWGGKEDCNHKWGDHEHWIPNSSSGTGKQATNRGSLGINGDRVAVESFCSECGAWRGQLGLEPTWTMYIDHINQICEEAVEPCPCK